MTLDLKQEAMNLHIFSLLNGFGINHEAESGARNILNKTDDFACEEYVQRKRSATWPRLAPQNDCDKYLAAFLDMDITKVINYNPIHHKLRPKSSTSTATI